MRQLPFGTAEAEVLLKLTSPKWGPSWSKQDGYALYESRALTEAICQGLVRHGFLDEALVGTGVTYLVTDDGMRKAHGLRLRRDAARD